MGMDKRTKLMLTAKKLFSKHGFYGTATARIAKDAGVSNGILFHYFSTKDKLIEAMYFDVKDRIFHYSLGQIYNAKDEKCRCNRHNGSERKDTINQPKYIRWN